MDADTQATPWVERGASEGVTLTAQKMAGGAEEVAFRV